MDLKVLESKDMVVVIMLELYTERAEEGRRGAFGIEADEGLRQVMKLAGLRLN